MRQARQLYSNLRRSSGEDAHSSPEGDTHGTRSRLLSGTRWGRSAQEPAHQSEGDAGAHSGLGLGRTRGGPPPRSAHAVSSERGSTRTASSSSSLGPGEHSPPILWSPVAEPEAGTSPGPASGSLQRNASDASHRSFPSSGASAELQHTDEGDTSHEMEAAAHGQAPSAPEQTAESMRSVLFRARTKSVDHLSRLFSMGKPNKHSGKRGARKANAENAAQHRAPNRVPMPPSEGAAMPGSAPATPPAQQPFQGPWPHYPSLYEQFRGRDTGIGDVSTTSSSSTTAASHESLTWPDEPFYQLTPSRGETSLPTLAEEQPAPEGEPAAPAVSQEEDAAAAAAASALDPIPPPPPPRNERRQSPPTLVEPVSSSNSAAGLHSAMFESSSASTHSGLAPPHTPSKASPVLDSGGSMLGITPANSAPNSAPLTPLSGVDKELPPVVDADAGQAAAGGGSGAASTAEDSALLDALLDTTDSTGASEQYRASTGYAAPSSSAHDTDAFGMLLPDAAYAAHAAPHAEANSGALTEATGVAYTESVPPTPAAPGGETMPQMDLPAEQEEHEAGASELAGASTYADAPATQEEPARSRTPHSADHSSAHSDSRQSGSAEQAAPSEGMETAETYGSQGEEHTAAGSSEGSTSAGHSQHEERGAEEAPAPQPAPQPAPPRPSQLQTSMTRMFEPLSARTLGVIASPTEEAPAEREPAHSRPGAWALGMQKFRSRIEARSESMPAMGSENGPAPAHGVAPTHGPSPSRVKDRLRKGLGALPPRELALPVRDETPPTEDGAAPAVVVSPSSVSPDFGPLGALPSGGSSPMSPTASSGPEAPAALPEKRATDDLALSSAAPAASQKSALKTSKSSGLLSAMASQAQRKSAHKRAAQAAADDDPLARSVEVPPSVQRADSNASRHTADTSEELGMPTTPKQPKSAPNSLRRMRRHEPDAPEPPRLAASWTSVADLRAVASGGADTPVAPASAGAERPVTRTKRNKSQPTLSIDDDHEFLQVLEQVRRQHKERLANRAARKASMPNLRQVHAPESPVLSRPPLPGRMPPGPASSESHGEPEERPAVEAAPAVGSFLDVGSDESLEPDESTSDREERERERPMSMDTSESAEAIPNELGIGRASGKVPDQPFTNDDDWKKEVKALFLIRELVQTEKSYARHLESLLLVVLKGTGTTATSKRMQTNVLMPAQPTATLAQPRPSQSSSTAAPAHLVTLRSMLPQLISISRALVYRIEENPSSAGVGRAFTAIDSRFDEVHLSWSAVVRPTLEALRATEASRSKGKGRLGLVPLLLPPEAPAEQRRLQREELVNASSGGAVGSAERRTEDKVAPALKPKALSPVDVAIMPTQRIARYCLLLRDLLSNTTPQTEAYERLDTALRHVQQLGRRCDQISTESQ